LGNLNRVVELRKAIRKVNENDLAYAVQLNDIINHQNKNNNNYNYIKLIKIAPKKLVKTSFSKDTVAKYLSIDGRYFGGAK